MREIRGDGFQNKHLRSLTIAAYLHCMYAAIEYAPTVELRDGAIDKILDPVRFRGITQLCDATDWDEGTNIGPKYLRVMRNIIKIRPSQD